MTDDCTKSGAVELADYPLPMLMLKPDLQMEDIYDIKSLTELQSEFKFFTDEDFEAALLQAQEEMNAELYTSQVKAKPKLNPPSNYCCENISASEKVASSNKITKNEDLLKSSKAQLAYNTIERSCEEIQRFVYTEEKRLGDQLDLHLSDITEEESESDDQEELDEKGELVKDYPQKKLTANAKENKVNATEEKMIKPSTKIQKVKLPESTNKPDLKSSSPDKDFAVLTKVISTMNMTFNELFQCIEASKGLHPLEEAEIDRAQRRNKEFESRFNRSLYQAEKEYAAYKNHSNQSYLKTGKKTKEIVRLKQLLRSCSSLLIAILHFAPLSAGQYFPTRFHHYLELLVDVGTILSGYRVNLQEFAKNLRSVGNLNSRMETDKMVHSTETLKNPQLVRDMPRGERSSSCSPKKMTSSIKKPKGTRLHAQRSNLARMKRMGVEAKNQNTKVQHPERPISADRAVQQSLNNLLRQLDKDDRKPKSKRDGSNINLDFTIDVNGSQVSSPLPSDLVLDLNQDYSLKNNSTDLRLQGRESSPKGHIKLGLDQAVQNVFSVQPSQRSTKVESKLLPSSSTSLNDSVVQTRAGSDVMDTLNCTTVHKVVQQAIPEDILVKRSEETKHLTSFSYKDRILSKETDVSRIMKRLHNLELLALREENDTVNSKESTYQIEKIREKENEKIVGVGKRKAMENLDVNEILSKLDMIKSDFAHIEQKYNC